jgi:hypothetical protein
MVGEYDFMQLEDREQKLAEFANKRQAWISTQGRGMTRFVLFNGVWREAVAIIVWSVLFAVCLHVSIALVLRVALLILLMGRVFNLLEWHWNERRYRLPPKPAPSDRADRPDCA